MQAAVRVIIRGDVQGVGYRAWTQITALELGLTGWVRNRRDGAVEAVVSGAQTTVDVMLERCREGPPAARVASVDQRRADASDLALLRPGERFSVLPTA